MTFGLWQFAENFETISKAEIQSGQIMDAVSVAQRSISGREREILVLVAHGFTNAEIGERLSITRLTVRTHLENIYAKLHVGDRTQAVVKYFFSAESEKVIGRRIAG